MVKKLPTKLPKYLYRYFWETKASRINPQNSQKYIAERLMDRGDLKALHWLTRHFEPSFLKKVYLESRNISRFSRPFWAAYLKIYPLKKLCSSEAFLQPPKTAWPY